MHALYVQREIKAIALISTKRGRNITKSSLQRQSGQTYWIHHSTSRYSMYRRSNQTEITIENVNSFRYCRDSSEARISRTAHFHVGATTRTVFPVPRQHSEERQTATAKFMIVLSMLRLGYMTWKKMKRMPYTRELFCGALFKCLLCVGLMADQPCYTAS